MIFMPISEAMREHPDLVKKYIGSVVPVTDNFFATLNSAVFSDGSFVYVPPGVRCPMELSTYFRINEKDTGQFERTLIIADKGSYVSYLEGCTAPMRDENQLHAAVVELVALEDAEIKYSTVQNWYPGDAEGKGGIFNFVTKRGDCRGEEFEDLLDAGRDRLGDHLEISELHPARRQFAWRVLFDRDLERPPAGQFRHQDDPSRQEHHEPHHLQGHRGRQIATTPIAGSSRRIARPSNARNFTNCNSLLVGDKCGAHTVPYHGGEEFLAPCSSTKPPPRRFPRTCCSIAASAGCPPRRRPRWWSTASCKDVLQQLPMEFAVEAQKLISISLEGLGRLIPLTREEQNVAFGNQKSARRNRRQENPQRPRPDGREGRKCTPSWARTARASRRSPMCSRARASIEVTEGEVLFDGENILDMQPDERAAKGVFLAFQYPIEIPGVATMTFLRTALNAQRKTRGEDEYSTPEFMQESARGAPPSSTSIPDMLRRCGQCRLFRRREEARRDPADGHARAAARGARRDQFRPRHRRAARSSPNGVNRLRSPERALRRDHALPAAARLHRAGRRACAVARAHREDPAARSLRSSSRRRAMRNMQEERRNERAKSARSGPPPSRRSLECLCGQQGEAAGRGGVAALREAAFKLFEQQGLPHRRIEEWKYTDLRALMRDAKPLAPPPDATAKARAKDAGGWLAGVERAAARVRRWRLRARTVRSRRAGDGLTIGSLAQALAAGDPLAMTYLGQRGPDQTTRRSRSTPPSWATAR